MFNGGIRGEMVALLKKDSKKGNQESNSTMVSRLEI
jgi:hypothetical protein